MRMLNALFVLTTLLAYVPSQSLAQTLVNQMTWDELSVKGDYSNPRLTLTPEWNFEISFVDRPSSRLATMIQRVPATNREFKTLLEGKQTNLIKYQSLQKVGSKILVNSKKELFLVDAFGNKEVIVPGTFEIYAGVTSGTKEIVMALGKIDGVPDNQAHKPWVFYRDGQGEWKRTKFPFGTIFRIHMTTDNKKVFVTTKRGGSAHINAFELGTLFGIKELMLVKVQKNIFNAFSENTAKKFHFASPISVLPVGPKALPTLFSVMWDDAQQNVYGGQAVGFIKNRPKNPFNLVPTPLLSDTINMEMPALYYKGSLYFAGTIDKGNKKTALFKYLSGIKFTQVATMDGTHPDMLVNPVDGFLYISTTKGLWRF